MLTNVIDIWFGLDILLWCLSLAYYAQEVVVEIGDNERGRFKIHWICEDFPHKTLKLSTRVSNEN